METCYVIGFLGSRAVLLGIGKWHWNGEDMVPSSSVKEMISLGWQDGYSGVRIVSRITSMIQPARAR